MEIRYVLRHIETGNFYKGLGPNESPQWRADIEEAYLWEDADTAFLVKDCFTYAPAAVTAVRVEETRTL